MIKIHLEYFIHLDHDHFKKQGCITVDEEIDLIKLYKEKCKLNQVISDNTNNTKLRMMPIIIHSYFGYPAYEISVK